jgi:hypothetical protein
MTMEALILRRQKAIGTVFNSECVQLTNSVDLSTAIEATSCAATR